MREGKPPGSPSMTSASPFFIVRDVAESLDSYRGRLGFEVVYALPESDPFFAIVRRDGAQLFIKAVGDGVGPLPNRERHPSARWDAFIHAPDPDRLAAEFGASGASLVAPIANTDDGLRGFEIRDPDGYILFFGRPIDAPR